MTLLEFENKLGYRFRNIELLKQALTHKSFRNEIKKSEPDNEKLEFLGDAVLDLALSEFLMNLYITDHEGQLSKKRASLVNETALTELAEELKLPEVLRLGKGEEATGGREKPRILSSALEALFGAIFTDSGYEVASDLIKDLFSKRVNRLLEVPDYRQDYKTRLQEVIQKRRKTTPKYELLDTTGPEHEKTFIVQVSVGDEGLATGQGKSKKQAEQDAANVAFEGMREVSL
jgi:ribonuclease-3